MFIRALSILTLAGALLPWSAMAQTPAPTAAPAQPPVAQPPAATPAPGPPAATPPPALPPAEAPAPAAVTEPAPAVPAEPAPAAAPVAAPAAEPPAPVYPSKLAVGTEGVFQPGVLLQGWFLIDRADETTDTFRLRRAELSAKGEIIPKLVSYGLMADFAKVLEPTDKTIPVTNAMNGETVTVKQPASAASALQDFAITFQSEYVDATVGQYKIPVSYEGSVVSSAKLLFAERDVVARAYGDRRDIGLKLSKAFKYFGYTAGFWNGAGQNNLDTNKGKELGLRFEVYPIEGLVIAGVAYGTVGQRDENGAKDRFEGDLRFEKDAFLFQAEYINARDVVGGAKVKGQGFYAMVAYGLFDMTLQPAVRVGYFDPNSDTDLEPATPTGADELFHVDLGVNYYLQKNEAKLLINYLRYEYQDRKPNNEVVLGAQVAF
jgi:hypothetical protein